MPILNKRQITPKRERHSGNGHATDIVTVATAREVDVPPLQNVARPIASHADARALYEVYRKHIEHEENVLSQRTTWALISQSVLIVAYSMLYLTASSSLTIQPVTSFVMLLIACLGVLTALPIMFSVWASSSVISQLRVRFHWILRHDSELEAWLASLPPLQPTALQLLFCRAPIIVLPMLFFLFWMTIGLAMVID